MFSSGKKLLFNSEKLKTSLLYFIGMASLVLADLFIIRYYPDSFIAEWAFLKSSLFIGGSIVVFGLDQMFIRHNLKVSKYLPKFFGHILVVGLILGTIVYFNLSKIYIVVLVVIYAINQLLFGAARANFHYLLSQALLQSWKIIFFIIVLTFYFLSANSDAYTFVLLALILPIFLYSKQIINLLYDGERVDEKMKLIYQDAAFMFLSIISVNIAMYADQLFLKQFALEADVVKLFTHTSSIYPLGVAFNGLAGFFLGPYLKKRPKTSVRKILKVLIIIASLLALTSFFIGSLILKFFRGVEIDFYLSLFLCIIIGLRILYILPSSYIGVIGSQKLLRTFVFISLAGVLIQIFGFLGLVKYSSVNIVYAAVFSVVAHWVIRTTGGIISIYYFKNRKVTS